MRCRYCLKFLNLSLLPSSFFICFLLMFLILLFFPFTFFCYLTSLHFTSLHFTSLHITSLHFYSLPFMLSLISFCFFYFFYFFWMMDDRWEIWGRGIEPRPSTLPVQSFIYPVYQSRIQSHPAVIVYHQNLVHLLNVRMMITMLVNVEKDKKRVIAVLIAMKSPPHHHQAYKRLQVCLTSIIKEGGRQMKSRVLLRGPHPRKRLHYTECTSVPLGLEATEGHIRVRDFTTLNALDPL